LKKLISNCLKKNWSKCRRFRYWLLSRCYNYL